MCAGIISMPDRLKSKPALTRGNVRDHRKQNARLAAAGEGIFNYRADLTDREAVASWGQGHSNVH